jgi:hypothetical protein
MHHYGGKPHVSPSGTGYTIIITNSKTGQEILIRIPRWGVFESDPQRELQQSEAERLAGEIGDVLSRGLV